MIDTIQYLSATSLIFLKLKSYELNPMLLYSAQHVKPVMSVQDDFKGIFTLRVVELSSLQLNELMLYFEKGVNGK